LLAGAGCFLGGCKAPPLSPTEAERWARAWIDSINSHRIEQLAPLLAVESSYEDSLTGRPLSRPEAVYSWTHAFKIFPSLRYEIERVLAAAGPTVIVEWKMTGAGVATAERPLKGVFFLEIETDKIARVRGYFDARFHGFPLPPPPSRTP
jgi:predicted ester cyclase